MTFELIVSATVLQDYVDTLSALVDEARVEFQESSVYTEATEAANVAMVSERLHSDACEHYESDGLVIGLNLKRLDDYLSKADSGDLVELTFDAEKRRIGIEYGDVSVEMAGIDPDSVREGQTLPEEIIGDMTTDIELDGAAFTHAIDVAGMVSDQIEFDSDPDRDEPFHVVGKGDTDDARVEFSDSLHGGSEIPDECVSLFSEDYLDDITSPIPKDSDVRLQHGEEVPTRLTYENPDAHVDVEFSLAPRIQSK